jgi:hypothetical protein
MKEKLLFISPHLDDIAFSLGNYIFNLDKYELIIATIFTKKNNNKLKQFTGDYYHYANYEERIKEDYNVMNILKKKNNKIIIKYLNFEDQIFRSNNNIQLELNIKMEEIIREYKISKTFLPLSIGYHTDHLLTFNTYKILKKNNIKILYYFDYPYCTMGLNYKIRLSDFGNFDSFINFNDIYYYYSNPINRSCPSIIRFVKIIIFLFKYLYNYFFKERKTIKDYSNFGINLEIKYDLVIKYKTQIEPIFGSPYNLKKILIDHPMERIIDIIDL